VALPVPAALVVLLRQAARPEPQATQAARIAVRMFSPLAVQAKMLSTPRGQELGRDLIRAPSINNSIWRSIGARRHADRNAERERSQRTPPSRPLSGTTDIPALIHHPSNLTGVSKVVIGAPEQLAAE
jgi:hypothetical protein